MCNTVTSDELITALAKSDHVTRTNTLTDVLDTLVERAPIETQADMMAKALVQHCLSLKNPAKAMRQLAAELAEAAKTVPSGPAH